jgi:hypothetical protein
MVKGIGFRVLDGGFPAAYSFRVSGFRAQGARFGVQC